MMGNFSKLKWAAIVAMAVTTVGCGGGGGSSTQLPKPTILFINGSPDSGTLQWSVNDLTFGPPLPYGGSTGDFSTIEDVTDNDGGTDLMVVNANTGDELERDNYVFNRDTDNLVLGYGLVNPGAEFEKRLQQLATSVGRRQVTGKARLYIFNGYVPKPGVSPRQINFQNVDPNDPNSTARPLYSRSNLAYGAFSETASVLDIDAGTLTFQARASDSDAVVVLAQTTYTFEQNRIYLMFVTGQESNADPIRQGKVVVFPLTTRP